MKALATVRDGRQGRIGGKVIDISENGCKLDLFEARAEQGQIVTIKLSNMESWPGWVRWVDGTVIGVQFKSPFHSSVLDHLCKANLEVEFS